VQHDVNTVALLIELYPKGNEICTLIDIRYVYVVRPDSDLHELYSRTVCLYVWMNNS
jgi:hypothetical protein